MSIQLTKIIPPIKDNSGQIVHLTDVTMQERRDKVLNKMKQENIDVLVIYNDLEHCGNFYYLTGFMTRFEEGILVFHQTGKAYLILGNENTKMITHSRINAELIHTPLFSLPNQPMNGEYKLQDVFRKADIKENMSVGVVGWKLFNSHLENNSQLFDIPHYIIDSLQKLVKKGKISNRTDLFIHPDYGVRTVCNANEIAHYEFGSSLASDNVLDALFSIEVNKTEMEIANKMMTYGQYPNVVPIVATGERFNKAYIFPSNKLIKLGDKMSITIGYKGGLASRSGYVATDMNDIPFEQQDYLDKVAKPYFKAVVTWLENINIGMTGQTLYEIIDQVFPKKNYHWHLNPGHLTSDEEWLSSPITEASHDTIKSGMLLQIDIIPSVHGYAGTSCENGIVIADVNLQYQIQKQYPEMWQRMMQRRKYIMDVLNIKLPNCVLPLSSGVAYYTPYFLNTNYALVNSK